MTEHTTTEDNNITDAITSSSKSEEVQSIIDRMPTYWVKWVVLCVSVLMGAILLFGFLIRYPAMQRYYTAINDVYTSCFSLRHTALYDFKNEKELEEIFKKKTINKMETF